MTTVPVFVIVGGGLAAAKAAESLRDKSFDGQIVMVAAEARLPYERPPLSKEYLADQKSLDEFTTLDADWYRHHRVDLRLGITATAIDPAGHTVTLSDGGTLGYDKLLLATGSRPRRPPIPGAAAAGVHYLRSYDDAVALKAVLDEASSLAIVGAGWIGLEVAAAARRHEVAVTVVESAQLPLLGSLGAEAGEVFATLHREHDVTLRLNTSVEEITTADGTATGLRLGDGSVVPADAVLVAVGAAPNTELAEQAGLTLHRGGVLVDPALRSSAPDIYAVGDIAAAQHPLFGVPIRTEHWANARKQPATAVAGMLGEPAQYDELPYFFTDQYDLGMEYVGWAPDYRQVVFRGDVAGREFVAFWLDGDDRVAAGMNVNIWEGLDDIKALIRSRRAVTPAQLADREIPLSEVAPR